jgi:hypothetical protein
MCVTFGPALMTGTMAGTYVLRPDEDGRHLHRTFYQNRADSYSNTPNCMLLAIPAVGGVRLVRGPETCTGVMEALTAELPELAPVPRMRGMSFASDDAFSFSIVEYGDYTVVLANNATHILDALAEVREDRRPVDNDELQKQLLWHAFYAAQDVIVLACFDGTVKPTHPIVVEYEPREPEWATIPGYDAHDGMPPVYDKEIPRDFKLFFGMEGAELPLKPWRHIPRPGSLAPDSVVGFHDNRVWHNRQYQVPVAAIEAGLHGAALAGTLRTKELEELENANA